MSGGFRPGSAGGTSSHPPGHFYRTAPGIVAADVAGEKVLLNLASSHYFGLNAVGAEIWSALEEPRDLTAIVGHVTSIFDVNEEQCARDVADLLSEMEVAGLVIRTDAASP